MPDLLTVKNLKISFHNRENKTEAVKGISFSLKEGKTLAVVGESGSGKSVSALSLARLLPEAPACQVSGEIKFNNIDILNASTDTLRRIRGKEIAYIFQEPSTSLNPVFTVGYQIAESIKLHRPEVTDVTAEVVKALQLVGIRDAESRYKAYPHEMSGGMQQRVMIAMALACRPRILVADEPTTALDVTIQKQIMDLLKELKQKIDMSIIMITHNFGIVKDFADEVIVMYQGKIVEQGNTNDVLNNPQHPYTQALIACIPKLGQKKERLTTIDHSKL
jgi:ABC-type dipeptide/oligopeptide/nickel transport system ATPase component